MAPKVKKVEREHPAWLRELWHYDPAYPYDTDTYAYDDWSTTDPYYMHEEVRLSPTNRHDVFLGKAKANLLRCLQLVGQSYPVSREVMIRDLPEVPGASRQRPSVIPDLALWPEQVGLDDPKGLSWLRHGAPLLVLEVLSTSTHTKDLEDNPPLYRAMGVQEYWVCDPDQMQWEAVYQVGDTGTWEKVDLQGKASLHSPLLQINLRVHATDGFQGQNPDTGQWVEALTSVRQEGHAEGQIEERRNSLRAIARLLADEARAAGLEEELTHTPFDRWPTVDDLYWRYTGTSDDTP